MKKLFCVTVLSLMLAISCTQVAKIKETPSGRPEAMFINESTDQVKNKIITKCDHAGIMLVDSSNNHLTFTRQLTGGQEFAIKMGYGTHATGQNILRFIFIEQGKNTKVTAHIYTEARNALGGIDRLNSGNEDFNAIQKLLYSLGGQ